jgi:exodeoxyribonuclease-3
MKLASWNINGIRSVHKKGDLAAFVDRVKPDILCLQETKAAEHESPVDFPEYQEYWNSSKARKGYSGTAIFSSIEPLNVLYGLPKPLLKKYDMDNDPYGNPDKEGRVIAAEYESFYVATVYTPNSEDDLSRIPLRHTLWDPAFLAYMKQLEKEKPVVFCGDLNVAHTPDDLANPKPNMGKKGFTTEERAGIDKMIESGFVDTFRLFTQGNGHYTWWSHFSNARARNVGWRIDYWFASESLIPHIKRSSIYADVYGSDHCPILLELDIEA